MTADQTLTKIGHEYAKHMLDVRYGQQRVGQATFNAVYDVRPDLADLYRATELDPFYHNDRVPAFLGKISEHLTAEADGEH